MSEGDFAATIHNDPRICARLSGVLFARSIRGDRHAVCIPCLGGTPRAVLAVGLPVVFHAVPSESGVLRLRARQAWAAGLCLLDKGAPWYAYFFRDRIAAPWSCLSRGLRSGLAWQLRQRASSPSSRFLSPN